MLVALALTLAAVQVGAQGFSFSQPDTSAQREQQAREQRVAELLSTPCRAELKNKKIMVVIGEAQSNGYVIAEQQNYGPHYRSHQRAPARPRARDLDAGGDPPQVAQAEIDAVFPQRPGRRARGREAPRRELRAARADLVAGRANPMMA